MDDEINESSALEALHDASTSVTLNDQDEVDHSRFK